MKDDSAPPPAGGTVEPVRRATVAKEFFQVSDKPTKSYELRDPFAEVTYRSDDRASIEAKANELGAIRFHERDVSGRLTAINRVNGQWERGITSSSRSEPSPSPAREERPQLKAVTTDKEVKAPSSARADPAPGHEALAGGAEAKAPKRSNVQNFGYWQKKVLELVAGGTVIDARGDPRYANPEGRAPGGAPQVDGPDRLRRIEAEATRTARLERLDAGLHDRYVIKRPPLAARTAGVGQTEYRFRGDTTRVAFTESLLKLSTDNNNPSVARSMVDVAETRKWGALKISGNEEFKRVVWLEASVRGIKTVGYEPHRADVELLTKELEARRRNRIEPAPVSKEAPGPRDTAVTSTAATSPSGAAKASTRGNGGRKAVLAALEAVMIDRNVPAKRREAVMTAAAEQLAQRTKAGEVHKIKILDKDAAPQRATPPVQQPKIARQRDRAGPTR
jgi:hypothetical protein